MDRGASLQRQLAPAPLRGIQPHLTIQHCFTRPITSGPYLPASIDLYVVVIGVTPASSAIISFSIYSALGSTVTTFWVHSSRPCCCREPPGPRAQLWSPAQKYHAA